jgi:hypothetical protein
MKEPEGRPTIREVLNEERVRDKLEEYNYALPAELQQCHTTTRLSSSRGKHHIPRPPTNTGAAKTPAPRGDRTRAGQRTPSLRVTTYRSVAIRVVSFLNDEIDVG